MGKKGDVANPAFNSDHPLYVMHHPHGLHDHMVIATSTRERDFAARDRCVEPDGPPCSAVPLLQCMPNADGDKLVHQVHPRLRRLSKGGGLDQLDDMFDAVGNRYTRGVESDCVEPRARASWHRTFFA